jgi:hypothetical protein
VRQPCTLLTAVRHDGYFHATVHLLLGSVRRPHKPIETRQRQEKTHQANAAGAKLNTDHKPRDDQTMHEGKTRYAVKQGHDFETGIEAVWYARHACSVLRGTSSTWVAWRWETPWVCNGL